MKKIILTLALIIGSFGGLFAQENTQNNPVDNLHLTANFQTNHLWRGLIITDKPVLMGQLSYDLNRENSLSVGIWGAASLSNESDDTYYKEIDYYLQYVKNGFSIALWDLFNTRGVNSAVASDDVWNYSKERTTHILDLRASYEFQNNFPLRVELDVMLYGGANAGEVRLKDNGDYKSNRYSTYLELSYPLIDKNGISLTPIVGAGFAFNPGPKGNTYLYGDGKHDFDIVNLELKATKKVKVFNQEVPISFVPMWNPSQKFARVQFATSFTIM